MPSNPNSSIYIRLHRTCISQTLPLTRYKTLSNILLLLHPYLSISQTLTTRRNFTRVYKRKTLTLRLMQIKKRSKYTDLFNGFFQCLHFVTRIILGGENRGGDGDTESTIADGVLLLLLVIDVVIGTEIRIGFGTAISLLLWLIEDRDGCRRRRGSYPHQQWLLHLCRKEPWLSTMMMVMMMMMVMVMVMVYMKLQRRRIEHGLSVCVSFFFSFKSLYYK